jgi:hypothetical protein
MIDEETEERRIKQETYDAAVECIARGYSDPLICFELGAIWQRNRHSPPCKCGETTPGPCIAAYPTGHSEAKCEAT